MSVPIIKNNGDKSAASLWLKEKANDSGEKVYIWIFEEIYESSLSAYVDPKGTVFKVFGMMKEIYGYEEDEIVGKPIGSLIPAFGTFDPESIEQFNFYGSRSKSGAFFPIMINFQRHFSITRTSITYYDVKITSLPAIAGMVTVHNDGMIQSISPVPSKYLFGFEPNELVEKMNIERIIPQFPVLVEKLKQQGYGLTTPIINNGTCRRALSEIDPRQPSSTERRLSSNSNSTAAPSIFVVHRDGSKFEVQLQLRWIESEEEELIGIWVTYDRIHALSSRQKRKASLPKLKEEIQKLPSVNELPPAKSVKPLVTPVESKIKKAARWASFGLSTYTVPDVSIKTEATTSYHETPIMKHHPLDDYVIVNTLGTGAYGTVKLAYRKDDITKKNMVIKYIMKSRIVVDSWIRDRTLGTIPLEIHILRNLQLHPHKNCCKLVTYSEDDEFYYVVMEAQDEVMDLFDYIELNECMTEEEIKAIFRQVAEGLQHLHQLHIVHRDIKDENVLLDASGTAYLIDFGSAAYFRESRTFDTFGGTLDYCAPEILKGTAYEGPPQDIWSLGILLYTLIYRETPFYSVDEILDGNLRIPSVPIPGAMNILQRMLDRQVSRRPSIDQVLSDSWLQI
ncbi:hypothetical protein EC973_001312 [Apophysomyces ossiformis]|uniref:Uncharacterized protein n=1 Tax=Apophysomyces ossiformis TaxID=679940 RepID=A0A8H7BI19_9FUNG|nr:hypothetical protein EC973_001312 [Apophysomyces ossiformis]